jgi:methionyl aminopeptidase
VTPPGRRAVPPAIRRPAYARGRPVPVPRRAERKGPAAIRRMRHACAVASDVLAEVAAAVAPGVTTDALDAVAHEAIVRRGAYPSTLGFNGYPRSLCVAVNDVACHGIPGAEALAEGDLVTLDVTVYVDGVHGDVAQTFGVGRIAPEAAALAAATRRALAAGIAAARPGLPVNAIGRAIEEEVGDGFLVVDEFVGHEIGRDFHGALVVHHRHVPGATTVLEPGMTLTVEPILTSGRGGVRIDADGWTARTADGALAAQEEHTVLITPAGAEPLTRHVA